MLFGDSIDRKASSIANLFGRVTTGPLVVVDFFAPRMDSDDVAATVELVRIMNPTGVTFRPEATVLPEIERSYSRCVFGNEGE